MVSARAQDVSKRFEFVQEYIRELGQSERTRVAFEAEEAGASDDRKLFILVRADETIQLQLQDYRGVLTTFRDVKDDELRDTLQLLRTSYLAKMAMLEKAKQIVKSYFTF
jgi:hypothetical protein